MLGGSKVGSGTGIAKSMTGNGTAGANDAIIKLKRDEFGAKARDKTEDCI